MAKLHGILARLFFAIAIILFAWAAYLYWRGDDLPGASVEEPDREFASLPVGKNALVFKLNNPTRHTVRVIGYNFC